MSTKNNFTYKNKIIITIALFLIGVIIVVFCMNSLRMYNDTKRRTEMYLEDVTHQTKSKVDELINYSVYTLNYIKEGVDSLPAQSRNEYLQDMKENSIFNDFIEFESLDQTQQWLKQEYGNEYELDRELLSKGKTQLIAIHDQDRVLYVLSKGTNHILIGIAANESLEALLNDNCFNGQGKSIPILDSGIVITENSDVNIFDVLQEEYDISTEDLNKIKSSIQNHEKGHVHIKDNKKTEYFMNYEPLSHASWNMVTIVPTSALGISVEEYAMNNLILTFLTVVILAGLITSIIVSQRRYFTHMKMTAFKDFITDGMNRNYFMLETPKIVSHSQSEYAIASLDIKDFKMINNVYGNSEGNRTLKYIYHVISDCLQDNELIIRDTADIFIVLLHENNTQVIDNRIKHIYSIINRISQHVQDNYMINIRCGVVILKEDMSIEEAIECANIARKSNMNSQKDWISFYDQKIISRFLKEKDFLSTLDQSLEHNDFEIYLQPKVNLSHNEIIGGEALVRWNHPKYGFLLPNEFIPVFEENNVIQKVDLYVFKKVCELLSKWKHQEQFQLKISVNVSKHNLTNIHFLDEYYQICMDYGVSPNHIELELTETIFMSNVQQMCIYIERMHNYGFSCSLDDFGTGYSSLSLLKDLNVDVLKLDRSFFTGDNNTGKGIQVVEALIGIAGKFHMQTVAEGIDTKQQLAKLKQIGCDVVQGYVFYKPLPVCEFEKLVLHTREVMPHTDFYEEPISFDQQYEDILTMTYHISTDRVSFSHTLSYLEYQLPQNMTLNELMSQYHFIHKNDQSDFIMLLKNAKRTGQWQRNELRIQLNDDRYKWLDVYMHYEQYNDVVVCIFINYTAIKESIASWKDKAYHDSLTQLYNREYFEKSLQNEMMRKTTKEGAIIFIDLDDFKHINDQYGHVVGDDILYYASMRMRKIFRKQDIIARYGGDEFVIFTPDINIETLEKRLQSIIEVFHTPYREGKLRLHVACSIGAIYFDNYICDYDQLFQYADEAMYNSKRNGKNQYSIVKANHTNGELS